MNYFLNKASRKCKIVHVADIMYLYQTVFLGDHT